MGHMENEKLFVPVKSEIFSMTVLDMMGDPDDMETGEVKVSLGTDDRVRVFSGFAAPETFLVALRCWSEGESADSAETWLRNQPEEEPEENEELPRFPLRINERLVVCEADGGFVFEDGTGVEYRYEDTVAIMKNITEYFED